MSFPDPNQPDPMRGQGPTEPLEHTLARIEAAGAFVTSEFCETCTPTLKVVSWHGELPQAVEVTHERSCSFFMRNGYVTD